MSARFTIRMAAMATLVVALFVLAGGSLAETGAEDAARARAQLEAMVNDVVAVLRLDDLPARERRDRIVPIVRTRFDFETLTRLVLARNYRDLSTQKRADFTREFQAHLSRHYGARVDRYDDEDVEILSERIEPRGDITIKTRIVGGQGRAIEVDYRMRDREGDWLVIDVVIEGISLVSNFRSQFQTFISRDGVDALLARLVQMNAKDRVDPDEKI